MYTALICFGIIRCARDIPNRLGKSGDRLGKLWDLWDICNRKFVQSTLHRIEGDESPTLQYANQAINISLGTGTGTLYI